MIKNLLKRILAKSFLIKLKKVQANFDVKQSFNYDLKRYINYSATKNFDSEIKLLGKITRDYHVIEKGLTMPKSRLGFGYEKIEELMHYCKLFAQKYDVNNIQFISAVGVILEYKKFHEKLNFKLDDTILSEINELEEKFVNIKPVEQMTSTKDSFFKHSESSFLEFSNSRHSIRNFSKEDIPMEVLLKAVNLIKNTPSACNRQTCNMYIYTDKNEIQKILELQGGNRGFGHLTNKLIVIVSELGVFMNSRERYQAYIDGGIYAMNLLYALHYYKIGCCILNCDHFVEQDKMMRKLCKIKESEIFIAMFACGYLPDNFSYCVSKRTPIEQKYTIN